MRQLYAVNYLLCSASFPFSKKKRKNSTVLINSLIVLDPFPTNIFS
ncbi:unnamed protein product [Musa acuminata subsp. malaccensis]|uniref:(wild Malaysian banana) hypothetical protein n=1 Tax=Musa acuminata subsp. malaccensis TaxID=214687 RepID=A0A804L1T5_MUSAM|nr:unnamed protein product [Musa acuminata subsp. malaccensis]